jgi:hypothetical protein
LRPYGRRQFLRVEEKAAVANDGRLFCTRTVIARSEATKQSILPRTWIASLRSQ